jgi:hypothetical protein
MVSSKKKRSSGGGAGKKRRAAADQIETQQRAGLPAQDSIISETTLRSPKGNVYHILKTNETDDYDKPVPTKDVRRRR